MQSGNPTSPETTEARISRLRNEIGLQISKLDGKIHSINPSDESVQVWTHKINVLKAALDYLSGKKIDLEETISNNPCYSHSWFLFGGWQSSPDCTTALLVNEVKATPVAAQSEPSIFITSAETFSLKGPRDSALLFFASWQDNGNQFSGQDFPADVMRVILGYKHDLDEIFNTALKHAAYGELKELKALLEQYPVLVLFRGTVTTPGGLIVENTTLLECAIGAGDWSPNPEKDPWMTEMIIPYFDKLPNGSAALERQLERCGSCLLEIENQQAYDLTGLMNTIKNAPKDDITAALAKKWNECDLTRALNKFRIDVTPGTFTEPHMHYNYQTLIHALELLDKEWSNLSGPQQDLFWRQVIGYLQRSLPAVDRFIFARGSLHDLVENKEPLERNSEYKYGDGSFPPCCIGHSDQAGPGFDIAIYGWRWRGRGAMEEVLGRRDRLATFTKTYVKQKLHALQALCRELRIQKRHA